MDGVLSRRAFIGAVAGTSLSSLGLNVARAQAPALNILSHRVHQQVATSADRPGGDITADWVKRNGRPLSWITLDNAPLHDRLQRELVLGETSIDAAYVLNTAISPRLLNLLEPLETHVATAPVEDFPDIAAGMVEAVTIDGSLRAIPIRHATVGLFYNEALFEEQGIAAPPKTIEELIEMAGRLTYRRPDGTPVNGFAFQGNSHFNFLTMAFAYDAPLISPDRTLLPNEAGMVAMFQALKTMFEKKILPRNFSAMSQDDVFTMVQNGRVAMALAIMGRYADFNDPKKSQYPGKIKLVPVVASADVKEKVPLVATSDFWSIAIPKNAGNKDLTWSLIRDLASKDGTLRQALNGNGPVRSSVYSDQRLVAAVPQARVEAAVLPYARPPLPIFAEAQRAADIMMQTSQGVVVGVMPPAAAVKELRSKISPLLKA
ncbi:MULTISPECIES: extracellular solute-binding protein [unclassified Chelatococcus]|uniref:ABC transporter substrate-binding protein n=1 Tax=unclassified Chelatococcus TaxID=2638111 RepID=UPI001BCB09AD|nr:extracellular solute-binding protein [Chelatococcus sp.]MBS7696503.1 extracellular solute-binding protein [Chelatococcus sp. YT9]MBX3555069.1 extracellular solute-binding protein [Chelatococcus sp.]